MTPQVISLSSLGSTAWIPVDYKQNPFNIGLACVVSNTPNLTYQVEFTLDDIFNTSITPTAFTHSLLVGKTSDFSSNQTVPVRAIRLTTTAYTSGTVTLTALQGVVNPRIYTPNPVTIAISNIPFLIMPGDGAANGCQFTGTEGAFTLSAAIIANIGTSLAGCYAYFSASFGGSSLPAGWYWTEFSSDTAGIVYAETYASRSGKPVRPATKTPITPNLSGWVTGSTSEIVGPSGFVLPGGALGKNGVFQAFIGQAGSTTATKTYRAKIGSTTVAATGSSASPVGETQHTITCMDSHTEKIFGRVTTGTPTGVGSFATTWVASNYGSIDTSIAQEVSFSLQQSTNVAAPVLLRAYAIATNGE